MPRFRANHTTRLLAPRRLACFAVMPLVLAACAGGGGTRSAAGGGGTPPAPPPPIGLTSATRCPSSSADCNLTGNDGLSGNRNSSGALHKRDAGLSELSGGIFAFAGGTEVQAGALFIDPSATLASDAMVGSTGTLYLFGLVRGSVSNGGRLYANQYCDDDTTGLCASGAPPGIQGDYQQAPGAALRVTLGMPLHVTGHASLAGNVELVGQRIDHWSPYILPGAGTRQFIVHADGGVSGQFSQWASRPSWADSPGIFLDGSLGYGPTDAWFDVVRSSLQATMSSAGSARPIVESAAVLDRAFALTDAWAMQDPRALTPAQRRMLASAASIQHIGDIAQASSSLPALAGVEQASALGRLVLDAQVAASLADARLDRMQPGLAAGEWVALGGTEPAFGRDRWLGADWLFGTRIAASQQLSSTALATPAVTAYLRWYGREGWYAGASASREAGEFALSRTIDLGPAGRGLAISQRQVSLSGLQLQGGRTIPWAGGTLTAFASFDATRLHSAELAERGGTGFELRMPTSRRDFVDAHAGMRFSRTWASAGSWLALDLAAGVQSAVSRPGTPLQASYIGLPDLRFDVPDTGQRTAGWTSFELRAGDREDWNWAFGRWGQTRPGARTTQWQFQVERAF